MRGENAFQMTSRGKIKQFQKTVAIFRHPQWLIQSVDGSIVLFTSENSRKNFDPTREKMVSWRKDVIGENSSSFYALLHQPVEQLTSEIRLWVHSPPTNTAVMFTDI